MSESIMSASEIYTTVAIARKDVLEEIDEIQILYLKNIFSCLKTFSNNPFLGETIRFIQKYYLYFFDETVFEKEMYDRIIIFFDNLDVYESLDEFKDPYYLEVLTGLLEYFELAMMNRLYAVAEISAFYDAFVEEGIMDDSNFLYPEYDRSHIMDVSEQQKMLELFPRQ